MKTALSPSEIGNILSSWGKDRETLTQKIEYLEEDVGWAKSIIPELEASIVELKTQLLELDSELKTYKSRLGTT